MDVDKKAQKYYLGTKKAYWLKSYRGVPNLQSGAKKCGKQKTKKKGVYESSRGGGILLSRGAWYIFDILEIGFSKILKNQFKKQ